ncbi:hypothetical protein HUU05_02230 [candidate division KSB1 bacterium]|nr:hypothetical protein [candidate division KSB1 bacterium]
MNAHRKPERAQRMQIAKPTIPEKESAAQSVPALDENPTLPVSGESMVPAQPSAEARDEIPVEPTQTRVLQLTAELEEEKRARENERKEKDALKKKLQEAEREMDKQTKAFEREKRETERQRLHYEGRLKELEQRMVEAQAAHRTAASSEASEEGNFSSTKATFRIDLYPHQGHFQGKIEHMLTHDKRAFSGLDQAAISEFIAAHLPQLETKAEELQKILTLHAHEGSKPEAQAPTPSVPASAPTSATEPTQHALRLRGMDLVLAGTRVRTNMLRDDQAFEVELELDRTEQPEAEHVPCSCHVALFAKRIEGGPRQSVGEAAHQLTAKKHAQPLRIAGVHLARGTYRLEALVNVQNAAAEHEPAYSLAAHKLIQIY